MSENNDIKTFNDISNANEVDSPNIDSQSSNIDQQPINVEESNEVNTSNDVTTQPPNTVYNTASIVQPSNSPISNVEPFNSDDIYTNYNAESYNIQPIGKEENNQLAVYSKENNSNNSNNKIEKSNIPDYCNYINNLIKDRNLIEETRLNISQLVSRGIDLRQCVQPLCDQEDVCNNRVDNQLHQLRYELETLKRKDDRIKSNINIDNLIHSLEDKSFEESFKIVIDIYDSLYLNLLEDIDVLNRAKQDILGYINLGLGLQDAVNTIDNEINDIRNVLCSSKERLDEHIRVARDESNIIV